MPTAAAKPQAAPAAPTNLHEYPPYVEQVRVIDEVIRPRKAKAEEALAAARRRARAGADNRAARVAALAAGSEPPAIEPDDHFVVQAGEELETATEALILAGQRLDQIRSEFAASCLAEVREARLEALRDQDEALAALDAAVRAQAAIRQSIRARGVGPSSPGWYAPLSLDQIAGARRVLRDCARLLGEEL